MATHRVGRRGIIELRHLFELEATAGVAPHVDGKVVAANGEAILLDGIERQCSRRMSPCMTSQKRRQGRTGIGENDREEISLSAR